MQLHVSVMNYVLRKCENSSLPERKCQVKFLSHFNRKISAVVRSVMSLETDLQLVTTSTKTQTGDGS